MSIEEIEKVAVIGAGTMGHGIAQAFASGGYEVVLSDLDQTILDRAQEQISGSLEKFAEKGKLDGQEPGEVVSRIEATTEMDPVASADFAVEAVLEKLDVKKEVFSNLDELMEEDVVLATNTSSISITRLGAETSRPAKVVGMHFFNPVPLMKLVEVVQGVDTAEETVNQVNALAEDIGKKPVTVQDYPGFVANRILCPMLNEAYFALMEGVGDKEAIDEIMKLGMGHPMGPLELSDMIGLDVILEVLEVLHEDLGDDKYRPCPLLRKKVEAGHFGKKTGRGFYNYE